MTCKAAPREEAQRAMPPDGAPHGVHWLRRGAALGDAICRAMIEDNRLGMEGWPPAGPSGFARDASGRAVPRGGP